MANFVVSTLYQAVDEFSAPLRRMRVSARLMARSVSRSARRMKDSLQGIRETAQRSAASIDQVFGAVASAAAFAAPVRMATQFEQALIKVGARADLSGDILKAFGQELQQLSISMPVAATDLAAIAEAAGQMGIRGEESLLRFTKGIAKVSFAMDILPQEAAKSFGAIQNSLGLTLDETFALTDAINHLSNNMNLTAAEGIQTLTQGGARAAKVLGLTAAEGAALSAALKAQGISASEAGTIMVALSQDLIDSRKVGKQFADMIREDATGGILNFLTAVSKVNDQKALPALQKAFGEEYAAVVLSLSKNVTLLSDAFGLVADQALYAGSAQQEYDRLVSGSLAQQKQFVNQIAMLSVLMGSKLLPVVNELMKDLTPFIKLITEWINKNPELTRQILVLVAALTGLMILGTIIALLTPVLAAFAALGEVLFLLSAASIAVVAPLLIIAGSLAAIYMAGKDLWQNMDELVDAFDWQFEQWGIYRFFDWFEARMQRAQSMLPTFNRINSLAHSLGSFSADGALTQDQIISRQQEAITQGRNPFQAQVDGSITVRAAEGTSIDSMELNNSGVGNLGINLGGAR